MKRQDKNIFRIAIGTSLILFLIFPAVLGAQRNTENVRENLRETVDQTREDLIDRRARIIETIREPNTPTTNYRRINSSSATNSRVETSSSIRARTPAVQRVEKIKLEEETRERIRSRVLERKAEILERVEERRAQIREQREEQRVDLTTLERERIVAYIERIIRRYRAGHARLESITLRLESRLRTLEAEGFNTDEIQDDLLDAQTEITFVGILIDEATMVLRGLPRSTEPRASLAGARALFGETKQDLNLVKDALSEIVRDIKLIIARDIEEEVEEEARL